MIAAMVSSCLAGLLLVRAGVAGLQWGAAVGVIGAIAAALALADERVALALFALSFLTVSNPYLRLKVGGLWIPLPALVAGLICGREFIRRWVTGEAERTQLPLVSLLTLFVAFGISGFVVVNPSAYLTELVKWSGHVLVFISMIMVLRRPQWVYTLTDGLTVAVGLLAGYGLYRVFTGLSYDLDIFAGVGTRSAASLYITAVLPLAYGRFLCD
jgi:hypothetical protein